MGRALLFTLAVAATLVACDAMLTKAPAANAGASEGDGGHNDPPPVTTGDGGHNDPPPAPLGDGGHTDPPPLGEDGGL